MSIKVIHSPRDGLTFSHAEPRPVYYELLVNWQEIHSTRIALLLPFYLLVGSFQAIRCCRKLCKGFSSKTKPRPIENRKSKTVTTLLYSQFWLQYCHSLLLS